MLAELLGPLIRYQRRASEWLRKLAQREPNMFVHWSLGILP